MDVSPGDYVCFEWNGVFYKVKVPVGVLPGKRFTALVNTRPTSAARLFTSPRPKSSSEESHSPIRKKKRVSYTKGAEASDVEAGKASGASSSLSAPKLPSLPRHNSLKWQRSRGASIWLKSGSDDRVRPHQRCGLGVISHE